MNSTLKQTACTAEQYGYAVGDLTFGQTMTISKPSTILLDSPSHARQFAARLLARSPSESPSTCAMQFAAPSGSAASLPSIVTARSISQTIHRGDPNQFACPCPILTS